ncbi:peptidase C14 [Paenibacillus cymbidii]|uniref:peptidase C14 n=1 Tax=Paenibacillus cymbidii TaxID=1639034 RepID=UPI00108148D8|nr:peptidase C14 [Paenibacillus cymbidii]
MQHVPDIAALLALDPAGLEDGALVYVGGSREVGDGGAHVARWAADCTAPGNGGTVRDPFAGTRMGVSVSPEAEGGPGGRWLVLHEGTGDYRWFGVMNEIYPADDALEAMVADPSIRSVVARSDLRLVRRHVFARSDITLDFGGFTVRTDGIEEAKPNDPFAAVLFFRGEAMGGQQTVTLTHDIAELSDVLEVADASAFAEEDWWVAQVDIVRGGAERELNYMLRVARIVDATHVQFNYCMGWPLAAGRTIAYKRMNPVQRVVVRDMTFIGGGSKDTTGSQPVAFEYAAYCDAIGIRAFATFWPVVMRRYNSHYVTERCELTNPTEVIVGGTGYLTQQINCLFGHVRDCHSVNARHLNDFTHAAYCMVDNCHAAGEEHGPYVTHGQYEHDLTYTGNSGLLSFANSGPTWGDSAKRITVRKHVGSRIIAHKKISDLTLEDCHAIKYEGLPDSGTIWVNADGVQLRGCTATHGITITQRTSRSTRPNVADGCSFALQAGGVIADASVTADFTLRSCVLLGADGNTIGGIGRLLLHDTRIAGASPHAQPLRVASRHVVVRGGELRDTGVLLVAAASAAGDGEAQGGAGAAGEAGAAAVDGVAGDGVTQRGARDERSLTVDGGAAVGGTNARKALLESAPEAGAVTWSLGGYASMAADAATAHFRLGGAGSRFRASGARFTGGKYAVAGTSAAEGYFLLAGCIEEGVDRTELPPEDGEAGRVRHVAGNLLLP